MPVISARQMLDWLDGRNGSSFANLTWNGTTLSASPSRSPLAPTVSRCMIPAQAAIGPLTGVTRNGTPVGYTLQSVKGVTYATVVATAGNYQVQYSVDTTPPAITSVTATPGTTSATISWTTSEPSTTQVNFGGSAAALNLVATCTGLQHVPLRGSQRPHRVDAGTSTR